MRIRPLVPVVLRKIFANNGLPPPWIRPCFARTVKGDLHSASSIYIKVPYFAPRMYSSTYVYGQPLAAPRDPMASSAATYLSYIVNMYTSIWIKHLYQAETEVSLVPVEYTSSLISYTGVLSCSCLCQVPT